MGRPSELYASRNAHLVWIALLTIVTNCRYLAVHQSLPGCASFPLVMQCLAIPCLLASGRPQHHPLRQAMAALLALSGVVCLVLSLAHLRHLLASTLSVLNGYVLLVMAQGVRERSCLDDDVVTPASNVL